MEAESLVDDDEYEDRQMDLSAKTCLQIPLQIVRTEEAILDMNGILVHIVEAGFVPKYYTVIWSPIKKH